MKTIRFLLEKEFRQIFRTKSILAMILVLPTMQLIILPLAADFEVRHIKLSVVDHDHSSWSTQLVNKIGSTGYFTLNDYGDDYGSAMTQVEQEQADLILEIPAGMEKNLVKEGRQTLFIAANAINGMKAGLGVSYLQQIIRDFNGNLMPVVSGSNIGGAPVQLSVTFLNWFNPHLNYHYFMVPGILAILVTMVGSFLTALNIVREKEAGTIEQINVTPIRKSHFIIGKLLPFLILGLVVFTIGLMVARIIYGIVPEGNPLVMFGFLLVYLPAVLGFGLLISTISETQQQAMFLMFFFMMVFILMGGLFTPIESMPYWAQMVAQFNPATYLIRVMRMVMLKGSSWHDVWPMVWKIGLMAVVLNALAIFNYRKTS